MKRFTLASALFLLITPMTVFGFGNMGKQPMQWNHSNPTASTAEEDAAPQPGVQAENVSGSVEQTIDSGGYTYVLLKKKDGSRIWVAVPDTKLSVGEQVTFEGGTEMVNFPSSTLKRTFDKVIFSNGLVKGAESTGNMAKKGRSPGSRGASVAVTSEKIKVAKAAGKNGYTIAEIFKKKDKLKNKQVVLNAKVVKATSNIMNRNWIHLQDGTGNHATSDNDLVVTSDTIPTVGDIVTVQGKLEVNKDFGSGYKYNVIIEKANITVQK